MEMEIEQSGTGTGKKVEENGKRERRWNRCEEWKGRWERRGIRRERG